MQKLFIKEYDTYITGDIKYNNGVINVIAAAGILK